MACWETVITSFLTSSAFWGLLIWRIKKSIQHEYDVKLEGFKAGYQKFLAENEIRFSWWHEEKAKAIKEIYNDLANASFDLTFLLTLENDPRWQIDLELKAKVRKMVVDRYTASIEPRHQRWICQRLFIEDSEDKKVIEFTLKTDQLLTMYSYCMMTNNIVALQKDGPIVLKELEMIMETLRHSFQDILQGRGC